MMRHTVGLSSFARALDRLELYSGKTSIKGYTRKIARVILKYV